MAVICAIVAVGIAVLTFANEIYLRVSTLFILSRFVSKIYKYMACIVSELLITQYPSREVTYTNRSTDWQEEIVARQILVNFLVKLSAEFILLLDLREECKEYIYIYIYIYNTHTHKYIHTYMYTILNSECNFFLARYFRFIFVIY